MNIVETRREQFRESKHRYRNRFVTVRERLLNIWGTYVHARVNKCTYLPTLETIFADERQNDWQMFKNADGGVIYSEHHPGRGWALLTDDRSRMESQFTAKIESTVQMIGMSVDHVLTEKLGREDRRKLLEIYPSVGPYQQELSDEEELPRRILGGVNAAVNILTNGSFRLN